MRFRIHGFGNGLLLAVCAFLVLAIGLVVAVGSAVMAWLSEPGNAPFWWRLSGSALISAGAALVFLNLG